MEILNKCNLPFVIFLYLNMICFRAVKLDKHELFWDNKGMSL